MAQLRADRRFDALVAQTPSAYEVRGPKGARPAVAEPALLEPQFEIASALYDLGRQTEALQVLDAGLQRSPAYGEDPSPGGARRRC